MDEKLAVVIKWMWSLRAELAGMSRRRAWKLIVMELVTNSPTRLPIPVRPAQA
jgi:hypothetical protein